jgi:CheY-like chemotaxis protein
MTAPGPKVLLVDEDRIQMAPFVAELELRGLSVHVLEEADSCLKTAKHHKRLDIAIIDVMLPSARRYSLEETQNHLYTGVFLARDIRSIHPDLPILLISNQTFREELRRIDRGMRTIGNCAFLSKRAFADASEFADIVEKILSHGIKKAEAKDIFGRLYRSIILQPKIAGIGVDLRELFRPTGTRR